MDPVGGARRYNSQINQYGYNDRLPEGEEQDGLDAQELWQRLERLKSFLSRHIEQYQAVQ